jgi:hypothetical protein
VRTGTERGLEAYLFAVAEPVPSEIEETPPAEEDDPQLPAIVTDDDLDQFLFDYFGIGLPHVKVCPGHSTPWDAFHEAYFGRAPVSVWKASRGFGGKTFTLGLLGIVEAITLRADVNVLGGSGVQSKRVLEHMANLWAYPNAPRWCLPGDAGAQVQKLKWGNRIQALMASSKSVRGPHPQRLRIDEADETKISLITDALGQPMSKGWIKSQVVLSSTHQYPNGPMTWILQEAAVKGWPVHEWCLHETAEPHGWLSRGEIERKRIIMPAQAWKTEVELQEPTSEGRAIMPESVMAAFREDVALEEPRPGARYGTGADWAKKVNHTVVVTIMEGQEEAQADPEAGIEYQPKLPARVVAVERQQRRPYPVMADILNDRVKHYGGTAAHDNSGLGQVMDDLLKIDAEAFDFVGKQRNEMLSEYISAIEQGRLVWPKDPDNVALEAAHKEHLYSQVKDVYGTSDEGHLPDTVSAGALAWRALSKPKAASARKEPEPDQAPHLQAGIQRGRLSGYIHGRRPGLPGRGR